MSETPTVAVSTISTESMGWDGNDGGGGSTGGDEDEQVDDEGAGGCGVVVGIGFGKSPGLLLFHRVMNEAGIVQGRQELDFWNPPASLPSFHTTTTTKVKETRRT